jgi:hypothetical protein
MFFHNLWGSLKWMFFCLQWGNFIDFFFFPPPMVGCFKGFFSFSLGHFKWRFSPLMGGHFKWFFFPPPMGAHCKWFVSPPPMGGHFKWCIFHHQWGVNSSDFFSPLVGVNFKWFFSMGGHFKWLSFSPPMRGHFKWFFSSTKGFISSLF